MVLSVFWGPSDDQLFSHKICSLQRSTKSGVLTTVRKEGRNQGALGVCGGALRPSFPPLPLSISIKSECFGEQGDLRLLSLSHLSWSSQAPSFSRGHSGRAHHSSSSVHTPCLSPTGNFSSQTLSTEVLSLWC